ncbi:hypothetical protein FRB94_002281 [Tulasnella sp. JGI-2019a]|nr:hypothetical protein FRB94_002281 [Tulasnella sp. JGI-2019a]
MPEVKGLEDLCTMEDLETEPPDWFAGIHGVCKDSGAHHLTIYTGANIIIGIFNADFTGIAFSHPQHVDICQDGYGEGINRNGIKRNSCKNMRICLPQVIAQVMMDAAQSPNVMTSGDAVVPYVFGFNKVPLAWNDGCLAPLHTMEEETRRAMRFSRQWALPFQREIAAWLNPDRVGTAAKRRREEDEAAMAVEDNTVEMGIEWASARSVVFQELQPPVPALVVRKCKRSKEPEDGPSRAGPSRLRAMAPMPRARSTTCTSSTGSRPAASIFRHMGVERTRSLDSAAAGDYRPAKHIRTTTEENFISFAPPQSAPIAGPLTFRKTASRNTTLTRITDSKRRHEVRNKAAARRRAVEAIHLVNKDHFMADEEREDEEKVDQLMVIKEEEEDEPVATAPAMAPKSPAESSKMAGFKATIVAKVGGLLSAGLPYVLRHRSTPVAAAAEGEEDVGSSSGSHVSTGRRNGYLLTSGEEGE